MTTPPVISLRQHHRRRLSSRSLAARNDGADSSREPSAFYSFVIWLSFTWSLRPLYMCRETKRVRKSYFLIDPTWSQGELDLNEGLLLLTAGSKRARSRLRSSPSCSWLLVCV